MKLRLTPALQELLTKAASDQTLPQELRAVAIDACGADEGTSVDWGTVKAIAQHARQQRGRDAVPRLDELCQGSGIAFPQPRKREGMPPELQYRLEELRARLEQQQYDAMVADVTQEERRAATAREGGLATYRQQISFGVHILAMMATFYTFGHAAGMALTSNKAVHPLVGLVLMVAAMLLETVLYILRTTVPPKLQQEAARRAVAARVAHQQERHMQEVAAEGVYAAAVAGSALAAQQALDKQPSEKEAAGKKDN